MAIDQTVIGNLAAALMEELGQLGDEVSLDAVGLIIAVDKGEDVTVRYSLVDGKGDGLAPYKALGLLEMVKLGITR